VGGVGGRIDKVGGKIGRVGGWIGRVGGRKERLGGLGGGIGFRLEMDFASSEMFSWSTVGSSGLDLRLGLSVRCCGLLSDFPRPIQFLECASRGMGEGRFSEGSAALVDCFGSLLWTLFELDADDDFLWEEDSAEGGGGGGSGGARGTMALWIREKVGGRAELEEEEVDWKRGELEDEEGATMGQEEEVEEEEADWKVSKVRGVA